MGLALVPQAGRHPGEHRAICVYGDLADWWVVCSQLGSAYSYLSKSCRAICLFCILVEMSDLLGEESSQGGRAHESGWARQGMQGGKAAPSRVPVDPRRPPPLGIQAQLLRNLAMMSPSFWSVSVSLGVAKPGEPTLGVHPGPPGGSGGPPRTPWRIWRQQCHRIHSKGESAMTIPKCKAFTMAPSCRFRLLAVFSFSSTVTLCGPCPPMSTQKNHAHTSCACPEQPPLETSLMRSSALGCADLK